jgi:hypothetical protein
MLPKVIQVPNPMALTLIPDDPKYRYSIPIAEKKKVKEGKTRRKEKERG